MRASDKTHLTVRGPNFVWIFLPIFQSCLFKKMKAWIPALLDAPRRDVFIRGLGPAVALSVSSQIVYLCPHRLAIPLVAVNPAD